MRISKWVQFDQDVEIDLSAEDIQTIFDNDESSLAYVLYGLNNVACFLKGVSDQKIGEMSEAQRKEVVNFLSTQAERYNQQIHATGNNTGA